MEHAEEEDLLWRSRMLRSAMLYGGVNLVAVALLLWVSVLPGTNYNTNLVIAMPFFILMLGSVISLLQGGEAISSVCHILLIIFSICTGFWKWMPPLFAISGGVLGGYFFFAACSVTIISLGRHTSTQRRFAQLAVFLKLIIFPLQLTALIWAAIRFNSNDNHSVKRYSFEGGLYCLFGLMCGISTYNYAYGCLTYGHRHSQRTSLRFFQILALEVVLAFVAGSRTLTHSNFLRALSSDQMWLRFLWVVCYISASLWLLVIGVVVTGYCLLFRGTLYVPVHLLIESERHFRGGAHEILASSPASVLLAPFVWHSVFTLVPLSVALGIVIFQAQLASDLQAMTIMDIAQGIMAYFFLTFSSFLEVVRPEWIRCIFWWNACFSVVAFFSRVFAPLALASGSPSILYHMEFASTLMFWICYVIYYAWCVGHLGSEYILSNLWEVASGGYFYAAFYTHEDAKSAGEAALVSLAPSTALTLLVMPLDVSAFVLCNRAHERDLCSTGALGTTGAASLASALWLLFTLILSARTRFKGPPAAIVTQNQLVWLLDCLQYAVEISTFIIMVFEFIHACNFNPPGGPIRALMITAAVIRLAAAPLVVLVDFSTREERQGSYTNAIGTASLVRMMGDAQQLGTAEVSDVSLEHRLEDVEHYGAMETGRPASAFSSPSTGMSLSDVSKLPFEQKVKWFRAHLALLRVPWEDGREEFIFHREKLLEESMKAFLQLPKDRFRRFFRFDFADEPGLDAGGVAREFFTLVAEALVQRGYLLLANGSDGIAYQMPPHPAPQALVGTPVLDPYKFIGRWMAKAVFDGQTIDLHLAKPIFKRITGGLPSQDDLKFYDKTLFEQLNLLRSMEPGDISGLHLDFSVSYTMDVWNGPGSPAVTTSLDGDTTSTPRNVDADNVAEYIELRWKRRVESAIEPQLSEFLKGFYEIIPSPSLSIFRPDEFELLACGFDEISVDDWRENTEYLGSFRPGRVMLHRRHPHLVTKWFWSTVESFDQGSRKRLLRFITGSSRVPVGGFAALMGNDGRLSRFSLQPVEVDNETDSTLLPRAHTCFNRLDLPLYKTEHQLRNVLKQVISFDEAITGFGLD